MVLALRAWKFDPRRILRATRDITPPSTFLPPPPSPFNRRKLFARSPAVWRRDERSKAASLRTLLSLASFFEPRFHRFWEARISSVASDYLPTFLECQPSLYLSLSLSLTEVFAPRIMKSSVYPSAMIRFVHHRSCFRSPETQTSALQTRQTSPETR